MQAVSAKPIVSPRPTTAAILADPRWQAILARDASATFLYSVSTTGIICRPCCPSRRPLPEHVTFYDTFAEALAPGRRACRRCDPAAPLHAREHALVTRLCGLLDRGPVSLDELARRAHLSPSHLHRLFRAHTGLTPRQYALARRRESTFRHLASAPTVTQAVYDAGFSSSSRFYEHTARHLGMTPSTLRAGAPGLAISFASAACTLGVVLVAQSQRGLCAILLGDDVAALRLDLARRFPRANLLPEDLALQATLRTVVAFLEAPALGLHLPLDLQGTAFQQRVWQALRGIPPGTTITYSELAGRLGQPSATRAVARACAANPLAVAVPCHRVLRADGAASGYRWGLPRKQALLARESGTPS